MTAQGEGGLAREVVSAEDFIHRMKHCFFADRLTHFVRPVGIMNQQTACGKWVWSKASKSLPKRTPVTCRDCVEVVEELSTANQAPEVVDPTQHRPMDCCEYCDDATFAQDPTTCPGWLQHRTKQIYRVEGWDADAWNMMSSPHDFVRDAERRMGQLKARFPEIPMRVVAETTTYMVVATAPAQTPPTEGDQVT